MTRRRRGAALLVVSLMSAACADTVVEDGSGPATSASPDSSPSAGDVTPTGSTDELLAELATAMASLSEEIIESGRTERETLARIDALWAAVASDIEATHPALVGNFEATIAMAHTAVTRIRPADADKAYVLFTDLVETYTGTE